MLRGPSISHVSLFKIHGTVAWINQALPETKLKPDSMQYYIFYKNRCLCYMTSNENLMSYSIISCMWFSMYLCWRTFKKYVRSRFPILDPPPPLFALVRFRAHPPPHPNVLSFWLEITLSPSISILVNFREKKLMMSTSTFGWTQCVF